MEKLINKEEVKQTKENLENLLQTGKLEDITAVFSELFALDDEAFEIVSTGILHQYLQLLNKPTEQIELVRVINASGITAEELVEQFQEISQTLNEIEGLSQLKKDFAKELIGGICNSVIETEGVAKRIIQIPIEFCNKNAKMPEYAKLNDSGLDVYSTESYTINPGETLKIDLGIKVALPPGYELQVRPRSGKSLHTKLRIANSPGTIDAGYRDEIGVIIENISPPIKDITYEFDPQTHYPIITSILHGEPYYIEKGDKIAQFVLCQVQKASFYKVETVQNIEGNRGGGFGHTGDK